jgi:hypothetical protein
MKMKLNKHITIFLKVLNSIISREDTNKVGRYDIIKKFNDEISDSRLTLNNQQFSKFLKSQSEYIVHDDRIYYIFEKKLLNNLQKQEESIKIKI